MDPRREQLIALLLGELEQDEAMVLDARLADDGALQRERDSLERQLTAIRALPEDDLPQAAVDRVVAAAAEFNAEPQAEQLARVITLRTMVSVYLPRIAAAAVFILMVGLAITYIPPGPAPGVGTVATSEGLTRIVTSNEMIEARLGSPLRVSTTTAHVLMDGGAAVSLSGGGKFDAPSIVVDRGRVVVDATGAAVRVHVGGRTLDVEKGAVVAVEMDREHAQILDGGAQVEVQRTTIERVIPLALGEYGLVLDDRDLPEAVRRQRVSFSGTHLNAEAFKRSFEQAASTYGVHIEGNRLVYKQGTPHRVGVSDEPEVVNLDLIQGAASCIGGNRELRLGGADGLVSVSLTRDKLIPESAVSPERTYGWARGMGNAVIDNKLSNVRTGEATLPAGAVIYPDRLLMPEGEDRIFLLEGADFNFPLPGGRMGRLYGTMSSGVLVELEDSPIRVFVPHSRVATRE
jgi:hypothetical protein